MGAAHGVPGKRLPAWYFPLVVQKLSRAAPGEVAPSTANYTAFSFSAMMLIEVCPRNWTCCVTQEATVLFTYVTTEVVMPYNYIVLLGRKGEVVTINEEGGRTYRKEKKELIWKTGFTEN